MSKLLFLVVAIIGCGIFAWNVVKRDIASMAELDGVMLDDTEDILDDVEENEAKLARLEERINNQSIGGTDDQMDDQSAEES